MLAIELHNLLFSYHVHQTIATLDIPHWQLAKGQRCFLYGPSGSGKSTLLRLLCGLMPPHQGQILLQGNDITRLQPAAMDHFRAGHIGLVSQQLHLLPYLSVADNIRLATVLAKKNGNPREITDHIHSLLDQLQLPRPLLDKPAQQLSQGQQQRVAIARALINQPALVLVDEPTSSLDYEAADAFMHLLLQTLATDTTVLMISHDRRHAPLFDQALSLHEISHPLPEGR
jgi:putative ABC transport system ATP-binding protein